MGCDTASARLDRARARATDKAPVLYRLVAAFGCEGGRTEMFSFSLVADALTLLPNEGRSVRRVARGA